MMSFPDFDYKQVIFYFSSKKKILRFKADNILIEDENKQVFVQHSCHKTFALFIIGNISLTSVVIEKAKKFGFPVVLLSRNFRVTAYFNNISEGNFMLRKKQYDAEDKNLLIAKQLVKQKINNQIALIQELRYSSKEDNDTIAQMKNINPYNANNSKELLGFEGTASKLFFPVYFRPLEWIRREPRTKRDINNLLLDIGYTYIFNFIEALTAIYGFDVYCGVYHTFFYQRKSLICDLVEPFRCIIDQRLRKAHNLKQIDENDFYIKDNQYQLTYKNQAKYTSLFMKDILANKKEIFIFIQAYYRWFMKNKPLDEFPIFKIKKGD